MRFQVKSILQLALTTVLLFGCSSPVVDEYITEIERTTKEIKAATSIEMITAATERLMKFEREHYESLRDELEGDKIKQASVNRAYQAFMQAGICKSCVPSIYASRHVAHDGTCGSNSCRFITSSGEPYEFARRRISFSLKSLDFSFDNKEKVSPCVSCSATYSREALFLCSEKFALIAIYFRQANSS